jgi:hypothetical protein
MTTFMRDIRAGARLAFSEYPLPRLRKRTKKVTIDDVDAVAEFFVYANAVVPDANGVLHDAEAMDPKSIKAYKGNFQAVATSSCGITGPVRAVTLRDTYKGKWCSVCFPRASAIQKALQVDEL